MFRPAVERAMAVLAAVPRGLYNVCLMAQLRGMGRSTRRRRWPARATRRSAAVVWGDAPPRCLRWWDAVLAMVCRGHVGDAARRSWTSHKTTRRNVFIGGGCICNCKTECIALQTFFISSDCAGKSLKQFHILHVVGHRVCHGPTLAQSPSDQESPAGMDVGGRSPQ